jgi:spore coat polysaccharide biosynthesis protein SpsF
MTKVVAIIQARMGSTRLPGKVMLPLGGKYVIDRVVERLEKAENVDEVVVATSTGKKDDIIEKIMTEKVKVHRGSEEDVLGRMFEAAEKTDADTVVRITGDCPILSPETVDKVVETLHEEEVDYASNILERKFPRGFDVEAFSFESFEKVQEKSDKQYQREHVTQLYLEDSEDFSKRNVKSRDVFDDEEMINRTDLRLTLDEADDYLLLKKLFEELSEDQLLDEKEIINKIDRENLDEINKEIEQKKVSKEDEDSN